MRQCKLFFDVLGQSDSTSSSAQLCRICNQPYQSFVQHLIDFNHINKDFLTQDFCSSLSLPPECVLSTKLPEISSPLNSLVFYLKSCKLPPYCKKFYCCHQCGFSLDSINLLFCHLNKCQRKKQDSNVNHQSSNCQKTDLMKVKKETKMWQKPDFSQILSANLSSTSSPGIPNHAYSPNSIEVITIDSDDEDGDSSYSSQSNSLYSPSSNDQTAVSPFQEQVALNSSIPSSSHDRCSPVKQEHSSRGTYKHTLQSRSNKRLLRNLKKSPTKLLTSRSSSASDTIILKSPYTICGKIKTKHKCMFCSKLLKTEDLLKMHYQKTHNFSQPMSSSDSILTRMIPNECVKKCFQFRCLSCMKMFESFNFLSQHRCKHFRHFRFKNDDPPLSVDARTTNDLNVSEYETEIVFFKNLGLVRVKPNSFCSHDSLDISSIETIQSADSPHAKSNSSGESIHKTVIPRKSYVNPISSVKEEEPSIKNNGITHSVEPVVKTANKKIDDTMTSVTTAKQVLKNNSTYSRTLRNGTYSPPDSQTTLLRPKTRQMNRP